MRKGLVLLSLFAVATLSGCMAGPNHLSQSVHDWQNNNYEEEPVVTTLLTSVIPVYPIVGALASIPDVLVLNPVQFWTDDLWDGTGSAFVHKNPDGKKKAWFKK
jgi:hypothetical protein